MAMLVKILAATDITWRNRTHVQNEGENIQWDIASMKVKGIQNVAIIRSVIAETKNKPLHYVNIFVLTKSLNRSESFYF